MSEAFFSPTYQEARGRFLEAAAALGAHRTAYPVEIPGETDLTLDVAVLGEEGAPTVVVSSGVHGVEGFFGSAVQLALLDRLHRAESLPPLRYVLLHGVNPYGFARRRRANEDNVDLNRNFLSPPKDYAGAPEGYAALDGFLNPPSPPSPLEPFTLKALGQILRHGLPTLKQAVAGGQYEFPQGLFFGGKGPSRSTRLVQDHCEEWIGTSQSIMHIDFHTGLGAFGSYKLLLTEGADSQHYPWYCDTFGAEFVEPLEDPDAVAYDVSGSFGRWMQQRFRDRAYRFVTAEFGTYKVIPVLAAMREENRAHHYGSEGTARYRKAKGRLVEAFCPQNPNWRRQVVAAGLEIVAQGATRLD